MQSHLIKILLFFNLCVGFNALASASQINPCDSGQIPPDQNACKLLAAIPPELRNLPYGIYPTDPEYDTARFIFNKRFNVFPHAIFAPRTPEEAAYVLINLKKYKLSFAVRSGGHCTEPGSLSSCYIIDLRNFSEILPDVERREVYIGAGAKLGTVIAQLAQIDFAIPTGTCPTVGVAGLSLGGGLGFLQRTYGLTCDAIKNITLLNANAEVIEINETSYPDLFWALRGGGNGSYGIVLGITFEMFYIPQVSYYELSWKWDPDLVPCIFEAWQSWVLTLPDDISTLINFRYDNGKVDIRIQGLKISSTPFTEWIRPFKKFHPKVFISKGSYLDSTKFWVSEPTQPFSKIKSKILMKPVSCKVLSKVIKLFDDLNCRKPHFRVSFNFEAFGGQLARNETAFFPRKAFGWWIQTYYWNFQEQDAKVLTLSEEFYAKISRDVSPYSYANIVDYDLGKRYLKAYYGDHVDRLIIIKNIYDPENIFHWKQSIPLSRVN